MDTLFKAIDQNDTSLVSQLIANGYDPNAIQQKGWVKISPLIFAVQKENVVIVNLLIKKGANIDWQDGFKTTALMYAAASGNEQIVKTLLEKGADVTLSDNQGNDALSAAKESKNEKVISLIKNARKKKSK